MLDDNWTVDMLDALPDDLQRYDVSRWRGVDDPGEVLSGRIEWQAPGATAPMVIDIQALFEEALR